MTPSIDVEEISAAAAASANIPLALALSTVAGLSTGLGGIIMVAQGDMSYRQLGLWQGAAAGFMLAVCFLDLLPEVYKDMSTRPVPVIAAFMLGGVFFLLLNTLVPEPQFVAASATESGRSGRIRMAADEGKTDPGEVRELLRSGIAVAVAIAMHNFPEGIAVCFSSLKGIEFGASLTLAIAMHNIPEGIAVAMPVYFATKSVRLTLWLTFLSGLAEPAGVVVFLLLARTSLTYVLVSLMLAAVAGIMVVLSLRELLPMSAKHSSNRDAAVSCAAGFVFMGLFLRLADYITNR